MTKINYSKTRLKSNLRMGIFFIALGVIFVMLSFVTENWKNISFESVGVGQIGGGIFMLIVYYFENSKQYISIKNGELIKNSIFPKKINLNEIKSIREFAGDLKLISEKNEFIINTQIVEPNSLVKLKNELKKYSKIKMFDNT